MKKTILDYLIIGMQLIVGILILFLVFDDKKENIQFEGQRLTLNAGVEIEKVEESEEEVQNKENIEVEQESYDTSTLAREANIDLAHEVINYAVQFVGNPYVYGGNSLTEGTDCSGFTSAVYANYGVSLPRSSSDQANVGDAVDLANIEVGDLVFHGYNGTVSHVAIYIGNSQVVHALNSSVGIVITDYQIMPIISIKRVL